MKKFDLSNQLQRRYGDHHRSGWNYVVNCLKEFHSNDGIKLETFVEKKFVFGGEIGEANNQFTSINEPWVGIAHVPDNLPFIMDANLSPDNYKRKDPWKSSYKNCIGLFTTSNYLARILEKHFHVNVDSFLHPTSFDHIPFSFEKYRQSSPRKIVQIGVYGRKLTSIFRLNIMSSVYKKIAVGIRTMNDFSALLIEAQLYNIELDASNVELLGFMNNQAYDQLLRESIGFIDLHDASANNGIIECLARATPVITRRQAAVMEYLGEDYPLYFDDINDITEEYLTDERLYSAHEYLLSRRHLVSKEYFTESILNSRIYNNI